jgi:hypothetical protein
MAPGDSLSSVTVCHGIENLNQVLLAVPPRIITGQTGADFAGFQPAGTMFVFDIAQRSAAIHTRIADTPGHLNAVDWRF